MDKHAGNHIFRLHRPTGKRVPVLLSSPHSGVAVPSDIAAAMDPHLAVSVPDTDFFVHELYGFGPEDGMTLVEAIHSRYVIDLNRDPDGSRLYSDERRETSLVPVQTFAGQKIYPRQTPDAVEIEARKQRYFAPYYAAIEEQLAALKAEFGFAIFWDCHSIKRQVPSISNEAFPDVILGNQDGRTCHSALFEAACQNMAAAGWRLSKNHPFKGGNLTRYFGRPNERIHALQLEMSQDLYMDEQTNSRDPQKQALVAAVLRSTLQRVIEVASQCLN